MVHMTLHPDYLTIGFYNDGFKLYSFYVYLVDKVLSKNLPKVHSRMT